MASLLFTSGPHATTVLPLTVGAITFGRLSGCDVQLRDHRVSREHCRFWFDPAVRRYMVADLGSVNGTLVNGVRLTHERELRGGELIMIGRSILRFDADPVIGYPADYDNLYRSREPGQELVTTRS